MQADSIIIRGAQQHNASFMNAQPCPTCGGARLRPEARAVTVGDGCFLRQALAGVAV